MHNVHTVCYPFSVSTRKKQKARGFPPTNKYTMSKPKAIAPQKPLPKFISNLGDPPAVLQGVALQVWQDTVPELKTAGIGTRVEANALACYCQAVADFHAAQAEINRLGLVVQTERGFTKNPACTIKNQAFQLILKFANAFGLTPASRGKVAFTPPPKPSRFDGF